MDASRVATSVPSGLMPRKCPYAVDNQHPTNDAATGSRDAFERQSCANTYTTASSLSQSCPSLVDKHQEKALNAR
jgi:hypothetical protein